MEDLDDEASPQAIDLEVELAVRDWRPIPANPEAKVSKVHFIDGVRRIDARVWIEQDSEVLLGLCASCAAGVVCCDGKAEVERAEVRRLLIAPSPEETLATKHAKYDPLATTDDRLESLMNGLAAGLSTLEVQVASRCGPSDLTVIDGPLRGREQISGAIGYIKSHRVGYVTPELNAVLRNLGPRERSPVFLVETSWTRYSWYMRLAAALGHPWAGIVRCEAPATLSRYEAVAVADTVVATLPRFASEPHKDGRAPQNLYPIKGLEDLLRSRLGNAELLYRSIRLASS